ncbi:hypothetical protein TTRE_0000070601 [Trichuris trichiura]|uniref:Uncharacterized protein n=1 Tax=Trichuris trichiura TaxID=36087 RepID=A0A077Z1I8_TRITR|nr:hypothetical protein TTRE_0000070601 [Trichuris trichiura]
MATRSSNNVPAGDSGGHSADEPIDRALSNIEFNMADVELREYSASPQATHHHLLKWRPGMEMLKSMFAFYDNSDRSRLLTVEKELMFRGQLVVAKNANFKLVRSIVVKLPDSKGDLSLLTIDRYKWVRRPMEIYFLYRDFATCFPPWLELVNSRPRFSWPDRYSLPYARPVTCEFDITTERFRKFKPSPSLENCSSIGLMVRITKVFEPHVFLATPLQWLKQFLQFRQAFEIFYDFYKEQLRLDARLLKVGLPVAFYAYGEWHRGEVLSFPKGLGLMNILYLDEGYTGLIRCDKVFHLVKSFTSNEWNCWKNEDSFLIFYLLGLLPPPDGWPLEAYEYVEEDCLGKDLFFLMTQQKGNVYEGYLAHGDNVKTRLRSLGKQWVTDNLVQVFGAIPLDGKPFEQADDDD